MTHVVYAPHVGNGSSTSTPVEAVERLISTVAEQSAAAGLRLYATGAHAATSHPLPASGELTIGRGADCDIAIDDTSVSRVHAVLHLGSVIEIEARRSHNGTRVGERRITEGQRRALLPGEVVHLGSATIVIFNPTPPRARHLWPHGYFEILVAQECARCV